MVTDGVRATVFNWTQEAQDGCPWRPLRDPFVRRVLDAYPWFDSRQIDVFEPEPSHRLIEGVMFYHRALGACRELAREQDREEAAAAAAAAQAK